MLQANIIGSSRTKKGRNHTESRPTMATESRTLKKAKLRHAEYYDFQETQDRLYAESAKGREFKHLMEIISRPENIRLAYRNHCQQLRPQIY